MHLFLAETYRRFEWFNLDVVAQVRGVFSLLAADHDHRQVNSLGNEVPNHHRPFEPQVMFGDSHVILKAKQSDVAAAPKLGGSSEEPA